MPVKSILTPARARIEAIQRFKNQKWIQIRFDVEK
jgi:hypothetical protein